MRILEKRKLRNKQTKTLDILLSITISLRQVKCWVKCNECVCEAISLITNIIVKMVIIHSRYVNEVGESENQNIEKHFILKNLNDFLKQNKKFCDSHS